MLQRRPPPAGAAEARRWRHLAGCSAQRAATFPRPPGCWSGGCGCPRACVAGARGRRSPRLAVGAPRRRRDLGGTGRSERPSLLPLLAPLSARRARSGSGAGASSSREAGASATPPEGAASWRWVYREGKGKGAERRGAAQNQLGHCGTDLGRKIEIVGRLRITVDVASHWGRNRPPFRSCKDCFSEHATVLGHCDCPWSLSHYEGIQHVQHTGSSIDFFLE